MMCNLKFLNCFIFLNYGWSQVTETLEIKTLDKLLSACCSCL
jgi:hypothetical protein